VTDSDFHGNDTQPIDIGEFNDFVDAMCERDALKNRVESLEAALGNIALSTGQVKRLLMRGLLSVSDIQKFLDYLITTANNARPILPRTGRFDQGGGIRP
jgi:hypothetical protein